MRVISVSAVSQPLSSSPGEPVEGKAVMILGQGNAALETAQARATRATRATAQRGLVVFDMS